MLTGSVGIGQVRIETARTVDLLVYNDYAMANESDMVIRSRLIYDWPYAIRTAAGYIKLLQNAGISGSWPQFMAYSLPVTDAEKWKELGHPMDSSSLTRLGFEVEKFQRRQQLFNDAVDRIG